MQWLVSWIPACHSALCLFTIIYLSIHGIASQSLKQSTTCAHAPQISHGGSRAYRPVNSSEINKINHQIQALLQIQLRHWLNLPDSSLLICMCHKVALMCLCVFSEFLISASRRKLLLYLVPVIPVSVPARPVLSAPDLSAICTVQRTVLYHRSLLVQSTVLYKCIPLPDLFHRVTHVIQL